jgi:mono/diheme cytochrome c family protein
MSVLKMPSPAVLAAIAGFLIAPCTMSRADEVDYVTQIKPILSRHCWSCHGALRQRSGLRLDAPALVRAGGDRGAAIVAGKSGESLLIEALAGSDNLPRMPYEGEPLKAEEIALLKKWIDEGAKAPAEEPPADPREAFELARLVLAVAEARWRTAQAELASREASIAADRGVYAGQPAGEVEALTLAAGKAAQELAFCKAAENLALCEHELLIVQSAAANNPSHAKATAAITAAEKKLASARQDHQKAMASREQPPQGYPFLGDMYPTCSTGRRLALARWITHPDHPLTARVAVNHLWLRYFGRPLVETMFDFGLNGKPPSHPDLLDWLAFQRVRQGWRMKPLHRLMVTSPSYRRASGVSAGEAETARRDSDNVYPWRMNVRRLEAELVRDAVLHAAGQLDLSLGGPDIDPNQGLTSRRRSVYFRHAHEKQMLFFQLFDPANMNECYRRSESITPQQALAVEQARVLAAG